MVDKEPINWPETIHTINGQDRINLKQLAGDALSLDLITFRQIDRVEKGLQVTVNGNNLLPWELQDVVDRMKGEKNV